MNGARAGHGLSISQRPVGQSVLIVRLGGELTSDSACMLARWVGQICGGHARVIHTDVSNLDYVDDPGAWTLALAIQCVRYHGNPVKIYNAPFALRCVLDVVCVEPAGAQDAPRAASPPSRSGRSDHESLASGTPPLEWLAMDLLISSEDPQLSSMFAIFSRLASSHGPPANAVISPRRRPNG